MRPDDDSSPTEGAAAEPAERLRVLKDRLRAIAADSDLPTLERAKRLALMEGDLLAFTAEEGERDVSFGRARGRPALAWAAEWREQISEKGLPDGAEAAADRLVEHLVEDDADDWRERAGAIAASGDAAACFDHLLEAGARDREAVARRSDVSLPAPLEQDRAPLRAAFLKAIETEQPQEAIRRSWALRLADGADVVLTGVDDLEGARAALQLSLTAADVDWHLRHVAVLGSARRRLKYKRRWLRREEQERELQGRLEDRFGRRFVAGFEKLIVGLILLVLTLLFIEVLNQTPEGAERVSYLSYRTLVVFLWADTIACFIFLLEFFVKLHFVKGRLSWFLRHFLIDLLPSIPFGLVAASMGVMDRARAGRALRLLRIARLTRYARAFGFIARGFDRLGRRYGHLLNHDVVLFPTRSERALAARQAESLAHRAWRLRSRLNDEWRELLQVASRAERPAVARARIAVLDAAHLDGYMHRRTPPPGKERHSQRDIPAEVLLRRLDGVTPAQLEADLGRDFVTRTARAVRLFARPPLRWLPVVRKYVPRVAPHLSDAQVTTAAAHRVAAELSRHHDRWFWMADLHGTVTPSEFVDRVGTAMVRSSFRPAYRLALFGLGFLILDLVIRVVHSDALKWMWDRLEPLLGDVFLVVGGICFFILGIGWWLKRLAGQATFFYEQTVNAQYLALTEAIKGRFLDRDAALLDARVFGPEEIVRGDPYPGGAAPRRQAFSAAMRSWLIRARHGDEMAGLSEAMERAVLLYRDGLDGALFTESDNRTTSQLLGNPALRQMRGLSSRVSRKEAAALHALDLAHARSAIRGPFLWYSFLAKAIAQVAARLIVEYNRNAIPLRELPAAADAERRRYEAWVETGKLPAGDARRENLRVQRQGYITTAFTALHFLDDDAGRDHEVSERFGPQVLQNLRRDRRDLFREVFGTYPLHLRPKEDRVLNLYRVYASWFEGGRAFLLPLRMAWRWISMIGRFLLWVSRAVGEIRTPRMRGDQKVASEADFATAVRKIGRMRGPVVWACLWLRARFDAEYLGVRLPGAAETEPAGMGWESDLRFLDAPPHRFRQVEAEQARAEADLRRLARLLDEGLMGEVAAIIGMPESSFGREHVRAATTAYRGDFRRVRALLSCEAVLDETAAAVMDHSPLARAWWPRLRLRLAFRRWWLAHGREDKALKRGMWRAVVHGANGSGAALRAWARFGAEGARARGVSSLATLLRHPGRISEQIVTLRIVQTLSLVDLLNYREHVYRLGDYEAAGNETRGLLCISGEGEHPLAGQDGPD